MTPKPSLSQIPYVLPTDPAIDKKASKLEAYDTSNDIKDLMFLPGVRPTVFWISPPLSEYQLAVLASENAVGNVVRLVLLSCIHKVEMGDGSLLEAETAPGQFGQMLAKGEWVETLFEHFGENELGNAALAARQIFKMPKSKRPSSPLPQS